MIVKVIPIVFVSVLTLMKLSAQVNVQKGSFNTSVPVYTFKDPLSTLAQQISLNYTSANGVSVDQMPSCIGEGWSLGGLGIITRVQKGTAPDDQKEKIGPWNDQFKYPNGYIFNPRAITDGCPRALNQYPLFERPLTLFAEDNLVTADREQDYFVFNFGSRSGRFVIGKDQKIYQIGSSNLKIQISSWDASPQNNCRTLINGFKITDENGIVYEFEQRDYTKLFEYYGRGVGILISTPHEIPIQYSPFVTNSWYLTSISDPLVHRSILIKYKTDIIDMIGGFEIQDTHPTDQYRFYTPGQGPLVAYNPNAVGSTLTISKAKIYLKKPEVASISFPTGDKIIFNYHGARKDCPGAFRLTEIEVSPEGSISTFYTLVQSYFVKNSIKSPLITENKLSRLALLGISKESGGKYQKIASYEYYLGENDVENFVPPIFFHAKDPWGYYNGDFCGVPVSDFLYCPLYDPLRSPQINEPVSILSSRQICPNNSPGSIYCVDRSYASVLANYNNSSYHYWENIEHALSNSNFLYSYNYRLRINTKPDYAKLGLLKTIFNEFGGYTQIDYEQNKFEDFNTSSQYNNPYQTSMAPSCVGGVHVSKISEFESSSAIPITTVYKYRNEDGKSSLWGIDYPQNISVFTDSYQGEWRVFGIPECSYKFRYIGASHYIAASSVSIFHRILEYLKVQLRQKLLEIMGVPKISNPLQTVVDILNWTVSCFGSDTPPKITSFFTVQNSIVNFQNALPAQFKRVEVMAHSDDQPLGKTVYEFTSPDTQVPLLLEDNWFPYTNKMRSCDWAYGLPKKTSVYDKDEKLINSIQFKYNYVNEDYVGINTMSCNCSPSFQKSTRFTNWNTTSYTNNFSNVTIQGNHNFNHIAPELKVEFYNPLSGRMELTERIQENYDKNGVKNNIVTQYEYNPSNYQVSSVTERTSEGRIRKENTYFATDFEHAPNYQSVITEMKAANLLNVPIVREVWQETSPGNPELLSFTASEFQKMANGSIKPTIVYSLFSKTPLFGAAAGTLDRTQSILRDIPEIQKSTEFNYDVNGNLIESLDKQSQKITTNIYGYNNSFVIASASNAYRSEIAYSSFENNEPGDWNILAGTIQSEDAPTGTMSLTGSNYRLRPNLTLSAKDYILTFWSQGTAPTISGLQPTGIGPVINGWTFYQFLIPSNYNNLLQVDGSGSIDEIRLYPAHARMTSTTYNSARLKSSECDNNNRIFYYEYDNFGRLIIVRDENKFIIRTREYRLKMQ